MFSSYLTKRYKVVPPFVFFCFPIVYVFKIELLFFLYTNYVLIELQIELEPVEFDEGLPDNETTNSSNDEIAPVDFNSLLVHFNSTLVASYENVTLPSPYTIVPVIILIRGNFHQKRKDPQSPYQTTPFSAAEEEQKNLFSGGLGSFSLDHLDLKVYCGVALCYLG